MDRVLDGDLDDFIYAYLKNPSPSTVSGKTLFALLVLVLIVLAPFTVLPALLESATARLLQDQLGLEEAPEVEIESTPAPMMYAGSFSRPSSRRRDRDSRVKTSNVIMDLDPFNLNIMESATSGEVSTEQPLSGKLSVELSEDNVSRLAQVGSGVPVQDVQLEDDQVVLEMSLGFGAPVTVRGRLSCKTGCSSSSRSRSKVRPASSLPSNCSR